jgi:hypothetical protein
MLEDQGTGKEIGEGKAIKEQFGHKPMFKIE